MMTTKPSEEFGYEVDGVMYTESQLLEMAREKADQVRQEVVKMRDEWVQYRAQSGVEDRWRRANALYHGDEREVTAFVETLKTGPAAQKLKGQQAHRSRVVVNIVRPKVDQAVARMCEILLPVDDRNWGIRPTPIPAAIQELVGDMRQTVDPATKAPTGRTADDEVQGVVRAAREACAKMERVIDDRLTECGYNGQQRTAIEDGVRLGPAIMKGPYLTNQTSKSWTTNADGTSSMVVSRTVVPASMRCDPWDVYFDPACGNDHQRGSGYWHRRFVTRKELRALVGVTGFDADAISAVLQTKPTRLAYAEGRVNRSLCKEHSYELWEYHGEIEPEAMSYASQNTGDPLEDVEFGLLLMVNDKIIGAMESWIVDGSLPMDVWCWRKSDSDPYGYGLPWELEHQQRVVTAAWRQVMDNARATVGGQWIVKKKLVTPQDGSYEITPNKVWDANPDVEDVTKAFTVVNANSHLQELLLIAEAAMKYADQETSMPQIMGGEKGSAPETVGGMVMLYNTAQAVLRMRVKLYDDHMTRPHIGRHYDWQMVNNSDPSIKHDMEVDARGSTTLLEKDIQNQTTMNLATVTSNPRFAAYVDPKRELTMLLKAFKVQPDDLMYSAAEIKAKEANPAPPPVDPRIEAANLALQGKREELEDRKEDRAFKAEQNAGQTQIKREQIQYNAQREQGEYEIAMTDLELQRQTAAAKIESDERKVGATLDNARELEAMNIDNKRQLFNAEAALAVRTGSGI